MTTDSDPAGGDAPVRPIEIAHLVVALDGSERSATAVPVADQLARSLHASVTVLAVVLRGHDRDALEPQVERTAAQLHGKANLVDGDNVPTAILSTLSGLPEHILCLASHGRGRSASVVGSVTAELAAQTTEPVIVVGPNVPEKHAIATGLVACADGSARSESVLPTAASWAAALGTGLSVVTVAEPIPEPMTPGAPYRRSHGPQVAAEPYIGGLVGQWQGKGFDVDGHVVYDPVSVSGGLADYLASRPTGLVVVATRARRGLARLVLGSHAASIIRAVPAPVLLVPEPG